LRCFVCFPCILEKPSKHFDKMHKRVKAGKEQPRVNTKVELKKLREPLFGSRDNDNIISLLILILLAYYVVTIAVQYFMPHVKTY